ncbi:MAG: glucosamine-6-phosphate deaminase [Planctomycetaceae bacterium]
MGDPRIVTVPDAAALAEAGADVVAATIAAAPAASVVVATGTTPMGLYEELAARRRSGLVDTDAITAIQLDEYLGLAPDDRRTLFGWMRRSFLHPLAIEGPRVLRLPLDGDLPAACAAFDRALEARGGIDLAILGLGTNGHLGFNEPPTERWAPTRAVTLTDATIRANARYWGKIADVPSRAVTIGLGPLLSARAILLVVSGAAKHAIVRAALEGPVGPEVPASFLRESGAEVTVVVDHAAWEGEEPT